MENKGKQNITYQNVEVKPCYNQLKFTFFAIAMFFILSTAFSQEKGKDDKKINEMVSKIKTEVDPEFVYDYEKTKYVPPAGKTLLIMGQTVEGINGYRWSFPKEKKPAGWSAYWAVSEFTGVKEKATNTTGTSQNHQMLIDYYPNTVLHSAMWMVGKWDVAKNTINGTYDNVIKQYCDWVKTIDRPVYLRLGYEFDGPHNELDPTEYIAAYKHIVDMMRSESVTNVAYVWHSYASVPYKNHLVSEWYPGDDYVDWVGVSVFAHSYTEEFSEEGDKVLEFAKVHKKPVMIAEANPIFGIPKNGTKVWDTWFVNFFSLVYNKNIKAICFINEDWTRINIEGISKWKDARLQNNKRVSKAWFKETNKDKYMKASPNLFDELGYKE